MTGRYRVSTFRDDHPTFPHAHVGLILQTVIHVGFSVWAIGCGCISTIRPTTSRGLMVLYMLLTGTGGGQVGRYYSICEIRFHCSLPLSVVDSTNHDSSRSGQCGTARHGRGHRSPKR